ncbi:unnamed protein product [Hydatigera taeniaeformis]|uniref:DNA_mis_repair domain-containing protein n=1 Tax=Hydatigena taeniaeformis TaxID=6205 RepID=A0A0R3X538_HYDTA|nr:unnamed protein product [Hydatigera taeniaeformis]
MNATETESQLTSSRIQALPDDVVNKIAAGEVIQRPCNAVKELIENSLDADSTMIQINLRGGGLKMIQVQDDGHGINPSDLPILCHRFTTSKLQNFEGLSKLQTFGFRGEALASLSYAAFRLTVTSRPPGRSCAYRAEYSQGALSASTPTPCACAGNPGTCIQAEDLFYNLPSRREALRSSREEFMRVAEVVTRYCELLVLEEICEDGVPRRSGKCGFFLRSLDRKAGPGTGPMSLGGDLRISKDWDKVHVIRAIFGEKVTGDILPLSHDQDFDSASVRLIIATDIDVNNRALLPVCILIAEGTPSVQLVLFINNRLVECASLRRAVEAAYAALLPHRAAQIYVSHALPAMATSSAASLFAYLSLEMPTASLDVNVHPTKNQVHFLYEDEVAAGIQNAIEQSLQRSSGSRNILFRSLLLKDCQDDQGSPPPLSLSRSTFTTPTRTPSPTFRTATSSPSPLLATSTYRPERLVRTDARDRRLEAFLNPSRASLQIPRSVSPDVISDTEVSLPKSAELVSRSSYLQTSDTVTMSTTSLSDELRLQKARRPVLLESVLTMREAIEARASADARSLLRECVFVGCVSRSNCLVQQSTNLLLMRLHPLVRELFYQLMVANFANHGEISLSTPAPVRVLLSLGLKRAFSSTSPSKIAAIVDKGCSILEKRSAMLWDYFSMKLDTDGYGVLQLYTIPFLLNHFIPDMRHLPTFLARLVREVNWNEEGACFSGICRITASFYAKRVKDAVKLKPTVGERCESVSANSSDSSLNESEEKSEGDVGGEPIEFIVSVAILDTLTIRFPIQVSLNLSVVCACCVSSMLPISVAGACALMVDEFRHQQRRYGRLSESSRSDDAGDTPNNSGSFEQSYVCRSEKSRKQNIRELRDDFDYDPELYGIRRSERGRKSSVRLVVDRDDSSGRQSSIAQESGSDSESEEDESSSETSSNRESYRVSAGRISGRTRGCRVNYTSAFKDASESDDEASYRRQNGSSTDNRAHRGPPAANLNRNQYALPQKPRGPLIRISGKVPERYFNLEGARQVDTSDAESYAPHHGHSSNESSVDDSRSAQVSYTVAEAGQQEVDVIEEVLNQAVRRVGATGNSTTLYNSRLEKDPNEGFDPAKEKGEMQYLIKWRSWSHIHSTWETEASLTSPDRGFPVDGMKRLRAYQSMIEERKAREEVASRDELEALLYEDERNELILSEKMEVDRVVAHSRDKKKGTVDYLCKWRRLDYRFCTWECGQVIDFLFPEAIEAYHRRCNSTTLPNSRHAALTDRPRFARILEQPSYIGGGSPDLRLRDYQLKGLNWIAHAWTRGNSVILADEMGLGKTVQAVSFLSYLFHEYGIYGPFLIVVPLSTISSWQKEIESWSPGLNLIVYVGDHVSRQFIREHEWSRAAGVGGRRQQMLKFNICMTTYEILLKDRSWLGQVSWAALVVDEAHRLKNDASQLYKALSSFDTNTRLLITGTPLQNSLKELWSLLHFLMPGHFDDWEEFEDNYSLQGQASSSAGYEAVTRLHRTIEPFLLRRVKKDVEQSLPAKTERILRVEMSKKQATLYRLILTRNYDGLMKVTHGHKASFINIMMELKKCCNHANLIAPPAGEDQFQSSGEALRDLIRGSGKLMLLDKLLQRLRPQGHRVLIFSQMVRMLDIIAEYLQFRGWGFQRLDGSIRGELRKQALDHFNADGSTDFCFLLSTRAGGLGINLATADTVVIFDSDWNPQNDIQAQARAHRIGQTKQVSVYRLVVKDSVEEKIIESATRKMLLDHLVIQRMDSAGNRGGNARKSDAKGQVLTEILRHGAESIFKQNDEETAEVEVDIDDILNRAETRDADAEEDPYNPANVLLSTFNVVTFDQSEQDDAKPVQIDSSGKSSKPWSEIIPEEMRENLKQVESQEALLDLELGPRRRKQVRTFQAGLDNDNYSSSSPSGSDRNGKRLVQLSDKEVRALVRAMKRFARPLERIEAIMAEAELPSRTNDEVREIVETIINGCKAAIESAPEDEDSSKQKGPMYYYGKVGIPSRTLLLSLSHLEILHKVLPKTSKEDRLNYDLPFPTRDVNWSTPWSSTDDAHLLVGVYEHGYDNWEAIKLDADLGLGSKLLPLAANERPQASHVRARVEYLLKALRKHCAKDSCEDSQKGAPRRHHNKSSKEHKKKHSKRLLGYTHSKESSRPGIKPKSAEFVESDDSSSGSDGAVGDADTTSTSAVPPLRIKKTPQKRHLKVENVDDRPLAKKAKLVDEKVKHEPIHSSTSRNPTSFTKQEEEEFRQMRGSLFLKCKQHLHPIKKLFKQLELLENHGVTEGEKFDRVMLGIGEHIRTLVGDIEDREERHTWRHLYWEFVQNFSEKDAFQLEQAYSVARKSEWVKQEPSSARPYERSRDAQDRKEHDHRHHRHRHRNQESQYSHRDDFISGRDSDKPIDRHRSRSHHRHSSDAARPENLNASSSVAGVSGNCTPHRGSSSTLDKRFSGDWSTRRNLNNANERSLKRRVNRNDWSGSSGNLNADRYNNAFNRPSSGFSDAFNNPDMRNFQGPRDHNPNSTSSSIPPPYPFQPPLSSQFSWQEQKSGPLLSSPPSMSGSSIIPPPIVSPPSSSSRDPRLFHNRQ